MNARAAGGVTAEDAPQADALGLLEVPGRPVAARLESAQRVLDEHSCRIPEVRCRACGQTGPCQVRRKALAVFEEHGRLPRHRPVAPAARDGSEAAGMGEDRRWAPGASHPWHAPGARRPERAHPGHEPSQPPEPGRSLPSPACDLHDGPPPPEPA